MTAPQAPVQQPNNLGAKPAIVTATITIKRKATGKVENYEIKGYIPAPADQPKED